MKKSTLLLLSILLFAFNSCKKDDDNEPTIPTVQEGTALVSATINKEEIGGSNLTVSSAYYTNSPIKDNSFKTIVSKEGTQVVFIVDASNEVRALSYTTKIGEDYEINTVDATSTINSLFLLTPGLSTTSPSETKELINSLSALSSYQTLKTHFKENLNKTPLLELISNSSTKSLFDAVIVEYSRKPSQSKKIKSISAYNARFSVFRNNQNQIELSNSGLRKANIYRGYRENDNVFQYTKIVENMDGATNASIKSLITGEIFDPNIAIDETYSPPSQTAITDYWVVGIGFAKPNEALPTGFQPIYDESAFKTIFQYTVLPITEVVMGSLKAFEKAELANKVWKTIKTTDKFNKVLEAGLNGTVEDVLLELTNFLPTLAKPIATALAGSSAGAIAGAAALSFTIGSKAATFGIFVVELFNMPPYERYSISTQLNAPILLSPVNNSQEQSSSVTFSWEKNPLAWKYVIEISKTSDFGYKIIKTTDGITTSLTHTLEPSTLYYWRVYCTKADGSPSENSEVWSFTTGENTGNETGTVSDYDGNVYKTIKIGNQWWMAENLKVTHYSDGTPILDGTGLGNFSPFDEGKYWFIYDDSPANKDEYGLLYSWYAATRGGNSLSSNDNPSGIQGIAPDGWHIPSDAEWKELEEALGFTDVDRIPYNYPGCYEIYDLGHMLKEEGDLHWNNQYEVGNDVTFTGFNALPSGRKNRDGSFYGLGTTAFFWTTTNRPDSKYYAWERVIGQHRSSLISVYESAQWDKTMGYAIRCVKD